MYSYAIILFHLLFLRSNDPVFVTQTIDENVSIGYGIAIGDVDGDGRPDIILADKKEYVWYRNGDWKRFVMIENLTEYDNVCLAARDIDGDGKVEIAVGAQWNPGETSDTDKSGSVHYLIRPEDPTQRWTAVQLHHEPTTHRMRWAKANGDTYHLIVVPLHGRGNKGGEGEGVKVMAYEMPDNPEEEWKYHLIDESMHLTHNLEIVDTGDGKGETVFIGGKEGIKAFSYLDDKWSAASSGEWLVNDQSFGELKIGDFGNGKKILAGVEPMHGNMVSAYVGDSDSFTPGNLERTVLAADFNQAHGVGVADFLGNGTAQVVAGWREPNDNGNIGLKLFIPEEDYFKDYREVWIDKDGMACEDLQIADLDGDGKPDIIAAGRSTHNLKIYWNKSN